MSNAWVGLLAAPTVRKELLAPDGRKKSAKPQIPNTKKVLLAIADGAETTEQIIAKTSLDKAKIGNAVATLKEEGLIYSEPVRYRLVDSPISGIDAR